LASPAEDWRGLRLSESQLSPCRPLRGCWNLVLGGEGAVACWRPSASTAKGPSCGPNEFEAGSISSLDLLTTEQSLVSLDAAVASADATLVREQIGVFKALGGGWEREDHAE
jgi:hypothetical protein